MSNCSSKLRMLYVLDILRERSDEEHPLSSLEISRILLEKYGIDCDRKATIYDDINNLIAFKDNYFNIEKVTSPRRGFCIFEREFELPELYLLCDAAQSARFITKKKSKTLVKKLQSFASIYQSGEIANMVYIDKSNKSDNNKIYISIDALHRAITEKKKVQITYVRHQVDVDRTKSFIVSPYALIWSNDYYYLVCNNDTKENLMHVRIDRIKEVLILREKARPFELFTNYEKEFDTADYASKMFNAFAGKQEDVKLVCDASIYQELLDRFGTKCVKKYSRDYLVVNFKAALSNGLVNWIMQFGDKIYIDKPKNLQSMFNNKLNEITAFQNKVKNSKNNQ